MLDLALRFAEVFLPLLYLLVAVCYGFVFFDKSRAAARLAQPSLYFLLLLHLTYLVLLAIRFEQFPAATLAQALSAIAFAIAVVYSLVEWRGQVLNTGFWMLALAFFFELLSTILRSGPPPDRAVFHNPLFALHAATGLVGYAAFVAAAIYGFLFLRVYGELKANRFSVFFGRLPSLEVLERMMGVALMAGFGALTVTVVTGAIWADQLYDDWLQDPKILVTAVTWLFYGGVILLWRVRHWPGRHIAVASLAGFVAVLFSMLAVNLYLTDLHGFH
ncbi:MAG: cytochrome c biogenesis protein CcsA [Acidobacteriota bacterium]